MYIRKRAAAAISSLIIGAIALACEWYILGRYGWSSLRLFPTWLLFLSSVYFLSCALIITVGRKHDPGRKPCPMLDGMILMGFLLASSAAIFSSLYEVYMPRLDEWLVWVICLVLPVLILLDWALFAQKGRWRAIDPFYWLALPICYAATMVFTAELMPSTETWRYPLELLDYSNFGVWNMLEWLLLVIVLDLTVGYALFLIDFTISGKLAKKIVLPHLQTVLVDEHGHPIAEVPAPSANPTAKKPAPVVTSTTSTHQSKPKTNRNAKTPPPSQPQPRPKSAPSSHKNKKHQSPKPSRSSQTTSKKK